MRRRGLVSRALASAAVAGVVLVDASGASAAPPGHAALALERLFGVSHAWAAADTGERQQTTSVALGLVDLEHPGYDTPRVGGDYVFELGLSLGTALGYARYERDYPGDHVRQSYWVLAPRVGFLLEVQPSLWLWPRTGLTLLMPGRETAGDHAAVSLEVPLIWLLAGGVVGLSAGPHLEIGFSPGQDALIGLVSTAGTISELGASLGAHVFF